MRKKAPLAECLLAATIYEKFGNVPVEERKHEFRSGVEFPRVSVIDFFLTFVTKVEQRFGSSVAMYFQFMRYVIRLDLFFFLAWLGLVIVPWIDYHVAHPKEFEFSGMDLLNSATGSSTTYGKNITFLNVTSGMNVTEVVIEQRSTLWLYYSEYKVTMAGGDMGVIYTSAILGTYLIAVLRLTWSMGSHIMKSVRSVESLARHDMAILLYGWDWNLRARASAHDLMLGTVTHMVAVLQECQRNTVNVPIVESTDCFTPQNRARLRRAVGFALSVGVLALTLLAIFLVAVFQTRLDNFSTFLSPAIITVVNILIPALMRSVVAYEKILDPRERVTSELLRIFFTKMASVVFLVFQIHWTSQTVITRAEKCDELTVGEMYIRLLLLNYAAEFTWTLVEVGLYKYRGQREFLPSIEMMDVYYREALLYIGSPYSPVIFLYGTFFNAVLFFWKFKISKMICCPPREPTRMGQSQMMSRVLLLMTVIISAVPTFFFLNKSMNACGPHVGSSPLQSFRDNLAQYAAVRDITYWVFNPMILSSTTVFLAVVTYFLYSIAQRNSRQNYSQVRELEEEINAMRSALQGGGETTPRTPAMSPRMSITSVNQLKPLFSTLCEQTGHTSGFVADTDCVFSFLDVAPYIDPVKVRRPPHPKSPRRSPQTSDLMAVESM